MRSVAFILASALLAARPVVAESHDETYLGASAPELHALVDGAAREGLPADLLVAKAREGVVKGVAPAQIMSVVRGLDAALATARSDAQPFAGAAPPVALIRALVVAREAGASAEDTIAVLRADGREHALEALAQLIARGCPSAAATLLVTAVARREHSLAALVGTAHGEPSLNGGDDVDNDNGRGPNRETSGARGPRSGGVAAGKNK